MPMRQHVYDGCVGWLIGEKGWRIRKIASDTGTTIIYKTEADEKYFEISGATENQHRARILLADLEKHFVYSQLNAPKN
jgi:hypothetical protein